MTMFIKHIINSPFIRKHDTKSILIKLDTEVNFQGLKLLPKEFSMFAVAKLRSIEFFFSKKNCFACNLLQRDIIALVGLPPAALGRQDIPHRRRVLMELDGAHFRYMNGLENLQTYLN